MPVGPDIRSFSVTDALRRWPADEPLAALCTGAPAQPDSPGWSILARPSRSLVGTPTSLAELRALMPPASALHDARGASALPFIGGWIGRLSYDVAPVLEPAVTLDRDGTRRLADRSAADDRGVPAVCWHRCNDAYVYDHAGGVWHVVGSPPPLLASPGSDGYSLGPPRSNVGREAFEQAVRRVIGLIRDGDAYQVNLAHRLSAAFSGSHRALFVDWLVRATPWFGALIEQPGTARGAVVSTSPELFLRFDPATRRLTTRPMKGTRPAARSDELLASGKDAAELVMIVDLMRNDLGRVCELGSVCVGTPRGLERHAGGTIAQTTGTVTGTLRAEMSPLDALLACFPPGSVTGSPKVRAMQIIDGLEPVRRGPYCGVVGFVSDSGDAAFSVAIRTGVVVGESIDFHVGAGIVADSDPGAEWAETLSKASRALWADGQSAAPMAADSCRHGG